MKNALKNIDSSAILLSTLADSDLYDFLWKMKKECTGKLGLKFFRGEKMRTLQGLYDEFSAALQFPYYFGNNWAAFDECLNDLSWSFADSYLLCITSVQEVLIRDDAVEFDRLFRTLVRSSKDRGGENPNLELMGRSPTASNITSSAC